MIIVARSRLDAHRLLRGAVASAAEPLMRMSELENEMEEDAEKNE